MSDKKEKHSKREKVIVPSSDSSDDQEEQNIEITERDDVVHNEKKEKKPVSQKKLESINKARAVRSEQLRKKREDDVEAKKLIEKAYHAEVEQKLIQTTLPKYSKSIKRQILEKLKAQKLAELKKQYGYHSESSTTSSSDSSSEEEEEVVLPVKKTKKPKQVINVVKMPKPKESKPKGILERYKEFGF
jgi:hypothetical protein